MAAHALAIAMSIANVDLITCPVVGLLLSFTELSSIDSESRRSSELILVATVAPP